MSTIKEGKIEMVSQFQLLQTMLIKDIQNYEAKLLNFLQNKIQSLQMQTLKFIDVEIETSLFNYSKFNMPEIDKKTRDSTIQLADTIMEKIENFKVCVLDLLPEYSFPKIEQQPSFKEILLKDRNQAEFFCEVCKQSFITEARLQRHINNKHRFTVPCIVCRVCFSSELVAWVHLQIIHTGFYSIMKCNYCQWIPSGHKVVRKHLMKQHQYKVFKEFIKQNGRIPIEPPPTNNQVRKRPKIQEQKLKKKICTQQQDNQK